MRRRIYESGDRALVDLDRTDAIERVAEVFFAARANVPQQADRDDIIAAAFEMYVRKPFDVALQIRNGRPTDIASYLERLIVFAVKAWREDQKQKRQLGLLAGNPEDLDFDRFDCDGSGVLSQWVNSTGILNLIDSIEQVHTPPYRIVLPKCVQPSMYRENPFYIPEFSIEPALGSHDDYIIGRRRTEKTWRKAAPEQLPACFVNILDAHRDAYRNCLYEMIPLYLKDQAWKYLRPRSRALLCDINVHNLSRGEIIKKRGLKGNQYEREMARLAKCGWEFTYSWKRGRQILIYNPVYDGQHSGLRIEAMKVAAKTPFRKAASQIGDHVLEEICGETVPSDALPKELAQIKRQQMEGLMDYGAEIKHHERLCLLLKSLVECPSYARGMSLSEMNKFIENLPRERQKAIVFNAISKRSSIVDAMSLGDFNLDIYGAANEEERLTLKELEAYFAA